MANPFSNRYQGLSNAQLLEILQRHQEYQPLAIEAARLELESRNLSEDELHEAEKIILTAHEEDEAQERERHEQINRVVTGVRSYLVVEEDAPVSKLINIISLILAVVVLYQSFARIEDFMTLLSEQDSFGELVGWSELLQLFVIVGFFGIGTFLFWKRNAVGWKLLAVYFFVNMIFSLISLQYVSWTPAEEPIAGMFEISPIPILLTILFYGGMFWTLCKQNIRGALNINNAVMYWTVAVAAAVTLLAWFAMML